MTNTTIDKWNFDLDVDLHPIFAEGNFDDNIHYDKLLFAFRLATKFLKVPKVVQYFFALALGDVEERIDANGKREVTFKHEQGTFPSKANRDRTEAMLTELAKNVNFVSVLDPDNQGSCYPLKKEKASGGFTGCRSRITLSKVLLALAEEHQGEHRLRTSYLLASLKLSLTICHELSHSILHMCRYPTYPDETCKRFVGNSFTSEEGFELEATLLGGGILSDCTMFNLSLNIDKAVAAEYKTMEGTLIIYRDWPDSKIINSYKQEAYPIVTKDDQPVTDPRDFGLMRDPRNFLLRFFDSKFWEAVEKKGTNGHKVIQDHIHSSYDFFSDPSSDDSGDSSNDEDESENTVDEADEVNVLRGNTSDRKRPLPDMDDADKSPRPIKTPKPQSRGQKPLTLDSDGTEDVSDPSRRPESTSSKTRRPQQPAEDTAKGSSTPQK